MLGRLTKRHRVGFDCSFGMLNTCKGCFSLMWQHPCILLTDRISGELCSLKPADNAECGPSENSLTNPVFIQASLKLN